MKIDADEYCLFWYKLYILAAKRKKRVSSLICKHFISVTVLQLFARNENARFMVDKKKSELRYE